MFWNRSLPGRVIVGGLFPILTDRARKQCFSTGFQRFSNDRKIPHAAQRDAAECTVCNLPGHAKTYGVPMISMVWHCDSWARRGGTQRFSPGHMPSKSLEMHEFPLFCKVSNNHTIFWRCLFSWKAEMHEFPLFLQGFQGCLFFGICCFRPLWADLQACYMHRRSGEAGPDFRDFFVGAVCTMQSPK